MILAQPPAQRDPQDDHGTHDERVARGLAALLIAAWRKTAAAALAGQVAAPAPKEIAK